eukprot:m.169676 g.169676  ORF g.169676 m.169676 type:complete len:76 (-) comp25124_c2_seq4:104-331(-)
MKSLLLASWLANTKRSYKIRWRQGQRTTIKQKKKEAESSGKKKNKYLASLESFGPLAGQEAKGRDNVNESRKRAN